MSCLTPSPPDAQPVHDDGTLQLCRERDVGVVCFAPFNGGILAAGAPQLARSLARRAIRGRARTLRWGLHISRHTISLPNGLYSPAIPAAPPLYMSVSCHAGSKAAANRSKFNYTAAQPEVIERVVPAA